MPIIDTNMSIFDSPVATKTRVPPQVNQEDDVADASFRHGNDKHGDLYDDSSRQVQHDVPAALAHRHDDDDDDSDENISREASKVGNNVTNDYEYLIKQASRWKRTMHGVLNHVYQLRIEAACTLDNFAMMYPRETFIDDDDNDDKDAAEQAKNPTRQKCVETSVGTCIAWRDQA